jgi:predicted permease
MDALWQDIRFGVRMLVKKPGFTVIAVLTLALGIGANTAIFSVVNGLLLHPAGVPHPEQVLAIRASYEKLDLKSIVISAPDFAQVRDSTQVFASAAMADQANFSYTAGGWPQRLRGTKVSQRWFEVFEAKPLLGRVFTPEEDQPHADHEVVLSYNTWNTMFGADRGILGRKIELNQEPYEVIGVMPAGFDWPSQTDLWAPVALAPGAFAVDNTFNESHFAVARTRAAVSASRAEAYMSVLTQHVTNDPRASYAKDSGWRMFAVPLTEFTYGDVRTPLFILAGAVGFVLLIACANVAGLLLARASGRTKEYAVRAALGASAARLARQTLVESLAVAVVGMLFGLVVAFGAIRALLRLAPENFSGGLTIPLDGYVLLFTAGMTILSALVFGAAPAWQITRLDPQRNLKEGRGAGAAGRGRHIFRDVLVVTELALALVLLAGAGLFLKSLSRLHDVQVGFRPHGLMTAAIALPDRQYDKTDKQVAFFQSALDRLKAAPGVLLAAAGSPLPFSGYGGSASFSIEGRAEPPGDPGPHGDIRVVSPQYFSTMGIPLLEGRAFNDLDRAGAEPVAVVDENLAHQYWPGEDAVGKRIRNGSHSPWSTIVGVVAHVRHSQVVGEEGSSEGTEGASKGVYYYPLYQAGETNMFLIVRTNVDPSGMANTIREAVSGVDPSQPVSDLKTMDERIALSMGPRRSAVALLSVFAAMAVSLAAIGLFGLIRYSVAQRTQEIGVRMALGATRADVLRMILGQGLRLAAIGVGAGLVAALALARVLASTLYGVSAADPMTFAGVALLLVAVALIASYIPAQRATRVDPIVALRYE